MSNIFHTLHLLMLNTSTYSTYIILKQPHSFIDKRNDATRRQRFTCRSFSSSLRAPIDGLPVVFLEVLVKRFTSELAVDEVVATITAQHLSRRVSLCLDRGRCWRSLLVAIKFSLSIRYLSARRNYILLSARWQILCNRGSVPKFRIII